MSALMLILPFGSGSFTVYCDSSRVGLGRVLVQLGKLIAYASIQLKKYEKKIFDS